MLNKRSGLKGICGENDMRTITDLAGQGNKQAVLALTMFCYRVKKYIGAYTAVLGGTDCLIFTGGIGENSAVVRQMACDGLEYMGVAIDNDNNRKKINAVAAIHAADSPTRVLVVPTNEELEIAAQVVRVLEKP